MTQAGFVVSVSELNQYANGLLSRDPLLCDVTVRGEITGFKRHTSGHLYFSLKDDAAQVRCVMFRQYAQLLGLRPADGMQVSALGSVSIYVAGGQYQLYVRALRQQGEGEQYQQFLLVKSKLQALGYFDQQRKRTLPLLPRCVGVVTSPSGAVIEDIRNVIARRFPGMPVRLAPATVQGPGAASEIAAALRELDQSNACDVIIVGRGGGSGEDLAAFNDEGVAEAIFRCSVPVVSAVGHETDVTIADFVADLRAPTPSAAAELCVPQRAQLGAAIRATQQQLLRAASGCLAQRRAQLKTIALPLPATALSARRGEVAYHRSRLRAGAQERILGQRALLAEARGRLALLDPAGPAKHGYALVTGEDGRRVTGVADLATGERVGLRLHDGTAVARVETLHRSQHNGNEKL